MRTIFAILAVDSPPAVSAAIRQKYPSDHVELATGQWLVADEGTAQSVSTKLGISAADGSSISPALVLAVSGYFGRKPPTVWEWIKSKWGT